VAQRAQHPRRNLFWVYMALGACVFLAIGAWRYNLERAKAEFVQEGVERELMNRGLGLPDAATKPKIGPGDYPPWYGPPPQPGGPSDDTRTGKPCGCVPGDPLCRCP
jgi:hypothetical protein